jgi:hypothetical protein
MTGGRCSIGLLAAAAMARRSVAATGLPLGTVLAATAEQDPRYAWREMNGVIVFRPTAAWDNPDDPLSKGDRCGAAGECADF